MYGENFLGLQNSGDSALKSFFNALEADHFLFFRLQILWLRSKFGHRLDRDLAGEYGTGEVASVPKAAATLYRIARLQYLQVQPYGQLTLPMVEGLIRFQRVTYSFLPNTQPAVFLPNGKIIAYAELVRGGRSPEQAVNYLIRRIRGAE